MEVLAEARRGDLKYKELKVKGVVDAVIAELEGSEAGNATKLARKYFNLDKALKVMTKRKEEYNKQLTGMVAGVFDEAEDVLYTRIVKTAQFTIQVAKQEKAQEKGEVDYEALYGELLKMIPQDLMPKVDELLEAHTRRWTPDPRKPSLRVKELEEGILDAAKAGLMSMVAKVKAYGKKLLGEFKLWGRSYDAKLNELKKQFKSQSAA